MVVVEPAGALSLSLQVAIRAVIVIPVVAVVSCSSAQAQRCCCLTIDAITAQLMPTKVAGHRNEAMLVALVHFSFVGSSRGRGGGCCGCSPRCRHWWHGWRGAHAHASPAWLLI